MNAETKHTPGPWKMLRLNNRWHVASHQGRIEVAAVTQLRDRERSTANARLIVAAPVLLEACKKACRELRALRSTMDGMEWRRDRQGMPEALHALDAAIAKAEANP